MMRTRTRVVVVASGCNALSSRLVNIIRAVVEGMQQIDSQMSAG